jgi:hypothetical protein
MRQYTTGGLSAHGLRQFFRCGMRHKVFWARNVRLRVHPGGLPFVSIPGIPYTLRI